jgi:hypothetical protein
MAISQHWKEILIVALIIIIICSMKGCWDNKSLAASRGKQVEEMTTYQKALGDTTRVIVYREPNMDSLTRILKREISKTLRLEISRSLKPAPGVVIVHHRIEIPVEIKTQPIVVDTTPNRLLTDVNYKTPYYDVHSILDSSLHRTTTVSGRDTINATIRNQKVKPGRLFRRALYQPTVDLLHANPDLQTITFVKNTGPRPVKKLPVGLGVFTGARWTRNGFSPSVGIGLVWNIIPINLRKR